MPINPSDIIPKRIAPEIATGPVVALGQGSATIQIRPGLDVVVSTSGRSLVVRQMVSVAIPKGNLSGAQILGGAAGSPPRVRYLAV